MFSCFPEQYDRFQASNHQYTSPAKPKRHCWLHCNIHASDSVAADGNLRQLVGQRAGRSICSLTSRNGEPLKEVTPPLLFPSSAWKLTAGRAGESFFLGVGGDPAEERARAAGVPRAQARARGGGSAVARAQPSSAGQNLKKSSIGDIFQHFDQDKSGHICQYEMEIALKSFQISFDEMSVKEILAICDLDKVKAAGDGNKQAYQA
eukprot:766109-Hanusia_phi.AAC.2